jgi:D-sedoheptulose 7-phosphate isomerase
VSKVRIAAHFQQSLAALAEAARDEALLGTTAAIADLLVATLRGGGKVLLAGNGGSAGDAQHIAAELVGRYKCERPGWPAIALTTDTSALTAIANDYGFEAVFARQVEALGRPGDVLWAFSTSGTSPNVVRALDVARARGLKTVGFTGTRGGALGAHCDHLFVSPSADTAVVQQIHLMTGHAICDAVEHALAAQAPAP